MGCCEGLRSKDNWNDDSPGQTGVRDDDVEGSRPPTLHTALRGASLDTLLPGPSLPFLCPLPPLLLSFSTELNFLFGTTFPAVKVILLQQGIGAFCHVF